MKLAFPAFLAMANAVVATASGLADFSAVFSMTNAANNEVIVWQRNTETGELDFLGSVPTDGSGGSVLGITFDQPPQPVFPSPGDPLASQDPMTVSGRCLLAVNAGSNTVSSIKIFGPKDIRLAGVYPTNGVLPVSVAALDDLVYVLNAGLNGSFQGYRLSKDSCLMTAIGESIELAQDVTVPFDPERPELPILVGSPAQIGFTPKGDLLVTIKINGGVAALNPNDPGFGTINHYRIRLDGTTSADTLTVTRSPRSLSAPFAFDFDDQGVLLLNEASIEPPGGFPGIGGVSFWEENNGAYTEIANPVSVQQQTTCWIRYNPVNECVYVTNTISGSISTVSTAGGEYELVQSSAAEIEVPLDLLFSADYKYLYAYSTSFSSGQSQIVVYEVGSDCGLTEVENETEGYDPALFTTSNGPVGVAIFPDFNTRRTEGEGVAPPMLKGFA